MSTNKDGQAKHLRGRCLIDGHASGDVLWANVGLSFWGGVDAESGLIVDQHHPLRGQSVTDRVVVIPAGRGSCTGSGVLLELLLRRRGPAAFVFQKFDEVLTLGVVVAKAMFDLSIPVIVLAADDFTSMRKQHHITVSGADLYFDVQSLPPLVSNPGGIRRNEVRPAPKDEQMLSGGMGQASRTAMEIVLAVAALQEAETLIDVSQAHIDACIFTGPGSLEFAERLLSMGAKFAVPTTLNSISIDSRRWEEIGMDRNISNQAQRLADAYMAMGAALSFTCAPYLLDTAPISGENIGWAESNAVVFANSVLGARTQKYPDFLDVCIALTGRAPLAGCHIEQNRIPTLKINVPPLPGLDDAFWPLVGYLSGQIAGSEIPLLVGLEQTTPSISDLKAFGAAFATTASAPMFHIDGVTPEARRATESLGSLPTKNISKHDLQISWGQLNTAQSASVGLVSLGNPHFALEEFSKLAALCSDRKKDPRVRVVITTSRAIYEQAYKAGHISTLESFGAELITDTCWCMLGEPVIPLHVQNLITNSAKYAHYAPGMVKRGVHFGSLESCVEAACSASFHGHFPGWLL